MTAVDAPAPSSFTCRRCGHCCQGQGGIVLTGRDVERLAGHLGLTPGAFRAAHTVDHAGKAQLKARQDGYCVFFDQGCVVHPARPDICRAWPYFRGNLLDASSWELSQDYCPGIDPRAGHARFVADGIAYLTARGLAHDPGPDTPNALRLDGIDQP